MIYSQTGKIEGYVDHFFAKPGFFMEIGCWHGELISQTAYLERERGWRGICVDPFPSGFEQRSAIVCNRAISSDGKPRMFIRVSVDRANGGDVSYLSGFQNNLKHHWKFIQESCDYEILQVETITIPQLCAQYPIPRYVEFLSIDTEGSELEILSSIDFDIYRFGMIAFEHNAEETVRESAAKILTDCGYRFFINMGFDDIYIGKELQ